MPMKMAATFSKNSQVESFATTLETLANSMKDMMGVFNQEYDGGDFCKGLVFGRDGANMLYEIAQSFVDEEERISYEKDKKKSQNQKQTDAKKPSTPTSTQSQSKKGQRT